MSASQIYIGINRQAGMYYGRDRTTGSWTMASSVSELNPGKMKIVLQSIPTLKRKIPGNWECVKWMDEVAERQREEPAKPSVVGKGIEPSHQVTQGLVKEMPVLAPTQESVDLLAALNQFAEAVGKCDEARMMDEVRGLDKEVFQIYHEIEGASYDARRICGVYKRLRNALVRRRQLKNNYTLLKAIQGSTMDVLLQEETRRRLDDTARMAWSKNYDNTEDAHEVSLQGHV